MKRFRFALLGSLITLAAAMPGLAQDWVAQNSGTATLLTGVWFTDANHGWAVGDVGTSIMTADGGDTWSAFFLTGQDLQSVAFQDESVGLIVGDSGTIFRTTNGGVSWSLVSSGTASNLAAVGFGAGGLAYAAGRDGVILRSTDDGASWIVVETGADRYRDLYAVGTSAWIVGNDGIYRRSTNGGMSWSTQTLAGGSDLQGVFFLDAMEGWAGGQNSTLIYTNDGGVTWTPRATGINVGIDAVQFVDPLEGWAVGNFGTIYHSLNGGLSWAVEASGTANELNNLFFLSAGLGWAVGDLGTILVRSTVTGAPDDTPAARARLANHPNPFNPKTVIRLSLPQAGAAELSVHDASGRRVRTLFAGALPAGESAFEWHGADDAGRALPSGVYLARLVSDRGVESSKLVLSK